MFKKDDDWTWNLGFDAAEIAERRERANTYLVGPSGFNFQDDHKGPRPECLHTLLGPAGKGKSTLMQSLVLAWCRSAPCLVYLTEENRKTLESKLAIMEPHPEYLTTKLHVVHEEEDFLPTLKDPTNYHGFLRLLDAKIETSQAKVLVIDNLTTSLFYEGQFKNTQAILGGLRSLAVKYQIGIYVLCHPKKGVNENKGLLSADDIRGSASLGLTSDYFYTLYRCQQTIGSSKVMGTFIYVNKSRHHGNQDHVYRLEWDNSYKKYYRDNPVSFDAFKSFMKDRDKL